MGIRQVRFHYNTFLRGMFNLCNVLLFCTIEIFDLMFTVK